MEWQVPNRNPDMLRGTVESLILTALGPGTHHGFGITHWLEVTLDDELQAGGKALCIGAPLDGTAQTAWSPSG